MDGRQIVLGFCSKENIISRYAKSIAELTHVFCSETTGAKFDCAEKRTGEIRLFGKCFTGISQCLAGFSDTTANFHIKLFFQTITT